MLFRQDVFNWMVESTNERGVIRSNLSVICIWRGWLDTSWILIGTITNIPQQKIFAFWLSSKNCLGWTLNLIFWLLWVVNVRPWRSISFSIKSFLIWVENDLCDLAFIIKLWWLISFFKLSYVSIRHRLFNRCPWAIKQFEFVFVFHSEFISLTNRFFIQINDLTSCFHLC